MYVCACLLHVYAYSKYVYAYNWVAHVDPMYAHAYSCPETLIRAFLLLFPYFIYATCLCLSCFSYLLAFSSLFCFVLLVLSHLCQLGF